MTPVSSPEREAADRGSLYAAVALGATLAGDAVLYLLLPLHASDFGVSLPEAGFLLAANRLVRIFGYAHVARFYAAQGARRATIVASLAAVVATFGYSVLSGVAALLVCRILWGLAFAAFNLANQALPTAVPEGQARRAGRARAVVAVGPAAGLLLGAIVAAGHGPRPVFVILGFVAAIAPFAAARIPHGAEGLRLRPPGFARPGAVDVWSFSVGFALDGVFIFGLGLVAAAERPADAVLAAAGAMALRYLVEIVLSPASGALAQRIGVARVLLTAALIAAASLAGMAAGGALLWAGILVTTVLRAVIQPLTGPLVAEMHPGPERVHALARQATWRDIGAGTGPLAAGWLMPLIAPGPVFAVTAALLAVTTTALIASRRRGSG